jgi:hypothetical protein
VSSTSAPAGNRNSWRLRVVCRPLASSPRISRTSCTSSPISRLTIVDFPTPDEPMSAIVFPGFK